MIRLSPAQLDDIHAQAEAAYPYESCGLLAGRREPNGNVTVTRVKPSPNVMRDETEDGGKDRFEVDPQVRFDLMRAVADTDEEIIGHYHAHPDHPAKPSETDLDLAFEPELVWLITAVKNGRVETTTGWRLNRDTREIFEIEIGVEA